MSNFRELRAWQKAKDLSVEIYKTTNDSKLFLQDYRLRSQICAAAVSIPSNIAEGDELSSNKQSNRHFYIAKGSVAELITQLITAYEIDYLTKEQSDHFIDKYDHISTNATKTYQCKKSLMV